MSEATLFAREGELLHLQGKTEESLRVLVAGATRHPANLAGRLVLARVCRETGRELEARDWLESALRLDASCPAARLQLAEMLGVIEGEPHRDQLRLREPWDDFSDAAVDTLLDGPAAAPAMPSFSDLDDEDIEPEIDVDSLPHVATVTLAEIYLQQGLKEQAAQIYRQLLERQPGDASVRKRLEEIEAG